MKTVLFVCLGNICRSPMAESILVAKAKKLGLEYHVESAGTGNWHVGSMPDERTIRVLRQNGIEPVSRARQVSTLDFEKFDYIIAMDRENRSQLLDWRGSDPSKISLMMDWLQDRPVAEVPDPYYCNYSDFEHVFDLLEQAIDSFIQRTSTTTSE